MMVKTMVGVVAALLLGVATFWLGMMYAHGNMMGGNMMGGDMMGGDMTCPMMRSEAPNDQGRAPTR